MVGWGKQGGRGGRWGWRGAAIGPPAPAPQAGGPIAAAAPVLDEVHVARGSPVLSRLSLVQQRHASSLPMIRGYLVQHLCAALSDERDRYFSMPLRPESIKHLCAAIAGQPGGEGGHQHEVGLQDFLLASDRARSSGDIGGQLVFRVIRAKLGRMIRQRVVGERGFRQYDIVVGLYQILDCSRAQKHVVIRAVAGSPGSRMEQHSVLLDLHALPLEVLVHLARWESSDVLQYQLDTACLGQALPAHCREGAPAVAVGSGRLRRTSDGSERGVVVAALRCGTHSRRHIGHQAGKACRSAGVRDGTLRSNRSWRATRGTLAWCSTGTTWMSWREPCWTTWRQSVCWCPRTRR